VLSRSHERKSFEEQIEHNKVKQKKKKKRKKKNLNLLFEQAHCQFRLAETRQVSPFPFVWQTQTRSASDLLQDSPLPPPHFGPTATKSRSSKVEPNSFPGLNVRSRRNKQNKQNRTNRTKQDKQSNQA
jgi:hypothetical protein